MSKMDRYLPSIFTAQDRALNRPKDDKKKFVLMLTNHLLSVHIFGSLANYKSNNSVYNDIEEEAMEKSPIYKTE